VTHVTLGKKTYNENKQNKIRRKQKKMMSNKVLAKG